MEKMKLDAVVTTTLSWVLRLQTLTSYRQQRPPASEHLDSQNEPRPSGHGASRPVPFSSLSCVSLGFLAWCAQPPLSLPFVPLLLGRVLLCGSLGLTS